MPVVGKERKGSGRNRAKQGFILFMDFLVIPTASEGLKPWGERKEGEEENLEPYLSSGGLFDLRFLMNTRRGCHGFHGEKGRNRAQRSSVEAREGEGSLIYRGP